jgi:hypothetical protein
VRTAAILALMLAAPSSADVDGFTGEWSLSLCDGGRKPCGEAVLRLIQSGTRICGDHTFVAPGAGRMNEGGLGSVKGIVVGNEAILAIRSGRNGGVVLGRARLLADSLHWEVLETVAVGNPPEDALILAKGQLKRTAAALEANSFEACSCVT